MTEPIIILDKAGIYQKLSMILSNVDLKVYPGEFVYLIGKVGSGKTSLLKTLYAELPLNEGDGWIAGYSLKNIKKSETPFLRRKIGMVFQDFQLLSDRSVYDNLMFVLGATGWKDKRLMKNRINDVLDRVGLKYKDDKMPHQLSGGEQQRVVIARALLNDPDIILADEPTGNLDPETSEDLMQLLLSISKNGRAVIMATHDYGMIRKFPGRTLRCEKSSLTMVEPGRNYFDFDKVMGF
ncbi:MAG: ATP-binding cassette domain-containing protein [Bacteroidales bacterium]|nr:ATP-binding cassette domain-containing protein [Bacteroidales bacterium]